MTTAEIIARLREIRRQLYIRCCAGENLDDLIAELEKEESA